MKKIFLGFLAGLFLLVTNSCKTTALNSEDRILLQKTWKHSYEEKTDADAAIYRPANYKEFSSSMFRQVYDLKANGRCEYLVLHPADAHYMAEGTWNYDSSAKILQIKDATKKVVATYKVLELKSDLLKVIKQ